MSACTTVGTVEVSENYDSTYDFTKLKTYNWFPAHGNEGTLVIKQIRNELKSQLAAKGFKHDIENADFDIAVYGGTEDKTSLHISRIGYGYGGLHGRGAMDSYEYKEGTLILHFVDRKTKQLIFQSTAVIEIDQNMTMEKRQKKIERVIEKSIQSFPPDIKKKKSTY